MTNLSASEAHELWMDSPIFQPVQHPHDWGDQETVGVCVKRINYNLENSNDFGIYLGKHPVGYVVAIRDFDDKISGGEAFETLESLHQEWVID